MIIRDVVQSGKLRGRIAHDKAPRVAGDYDVGNLLTDVPVGGHRWSRRGWQPTSKSRRVWGWHSPGIRPLPVAVVRWKRFRRRHGRGNQSSAGDQSGQSGPGGVCELIVRTMAQSCTVASWSPRQTKISHGTDDEGHGPNNRDEYLMHAGHLPGRRQLTDRRRRDRLQRARFPLVSHRVRFASAVCHTGLPLPKIWRQYQ